jgi:hypothetical protein
MPDHQDIWSFDLGKRKGAKACARPCARVAGYWLACSPGLHRLCRQFGLPTTAGFDLKTMKNLFCESVNHGLHS